MKDFIKTFPFICVLFATSCTPISKATSSPIHLSINPEETKHEYSEINNYRITWSEIFDLPLSDYYVYFYSKTCVHCQNLKNWIIEKALQTKFIFFVESSKDDIIENDANQTFYSSSAEIFAIPGYPTLIKVSNKNLVLKVSGETSIHAALNFLD